MTRSPLVVGLAGVFVGLTTVLVLVAVVTGSPVALLVAVPLALTAFVTWYHASGRLADRARRAAGPRRDGGFGVGRRGRVRDGGGPFAGGPRTRGRADDGPAPGWYEDAHGQRWFVDPRGRRWRVATDGESAGHGDRRRPPGAGRGPVGGGAAGRGSEGAGPGREGTVGPGPDGRELSRRAAYDRLGLEPGADEEAVRSAYRELVKEHHPDAGDGDEETFKRVTAAYERLVD